MPDINLENMNDEKAISILEEIECRYDVSGCYHPHWTNQTPTSEPRLNLDGLFTREELLAFVHFHPDNKKEEKNELRTTQER